MSNTSSGQASAAEPLSISVHTLAGEQTWSYVTLHEDSPSGLKSGWTHLDSLPPEVRDDLKQLCIDPENTFPAVVNGAPCVVIEQEFQASDSGDDWPETGGQVISRLQLGLLPKVKQLCTPAADALMGIVADPKLTFCGRPTLFVALPVRSTTTEMTRSLLHAIKGFAYPEAGATSKPA